jgi:hypothetical protein
MDMVLFPLIPKMSILSQHILTTSMIIIGGYHSRMNTGPCWSNTVLNMMNVGVGIKTGKVIMAPFQGLADSHDYFSAGRQPALGDDSLSGLAMNYCGGYADLDL